MCAIVLYVSERVSFGATMEVKVLQEKENNRAKTKAGYEWM